MSAEMERRIPKVRLCGDGNISGCHGLLHQLKLHIYWDDSKGGWVFYRTAEPMNDERCWRLFWKDYTPVPGWVDQQEPTIVFGRGKGRIA